LRTTIVYYIKIHNSFGATFYVNIEVESIVYGFQLRVRYCSYSEYSLSKCTMINRTRFAAR